MDPISERIIVTIPYDLTSQLLITIAAIIENHVSSIQARSYIKLVLSIIISIIIEIH
jgi:hypothetical protein